jgi:glycosyltransferase involved in cell wall biosynthesis
MTVRLRYVLITPARDEAANLARLAESLAAQTVSPDVWVIVDNGSVDGTPQLARRLAESHAWIRIVDLPGEPSPRRGAPIVRAFETGVATLPELPEIVVKLDADVSMAAEFFERMLEAFESDPTLGIASGTCWELENGSWRPQHVTRDHARGAVRAYRRECLADVLPLVARVGWDGIDELKAQTRGWRVRSLPLPIRHHRSLGGRDRRVRMWVEQGDMAHYMGYRPSYLIARAVYRALRDPVAVVMLYGYVRAALGRRSPYDDVAVRQRLRSQQSLRRLPHRIREALGRTHVGSQSS